MIPKEYSLNNTLLNIASRLSRNSEANASEFPDNSEEMTPCYWQKPQTNDITYTIMTTTRKSLKEADMPLNFG